MWGSARRTDLGIDIQTIHLHRQPAEMLDSYEELKHMDTAAVASGKRPSSTLGFNARTWFAGERHKPMREHGKRFGQANFFISSVDDTRHADLVHWVTLFRADEAAHCTAEEQLQLTHLSPHLMQALALNRVMHLTRAGTSAPGAAICDRRGALYHADDGFTALLRREWPRSHGASLPFGLVEHFNAGAERHVGDSVVVSQQPEQGLLFLKARLRCKADSLTPRETIVAQLLARGSTHKEVARLVERSPATVRNQVQAIYAKLEVSNVAALIDELRRAE